MISKYFWPTSRRWDKFACREFNFRPFFCKLTERNQTFGFYVVYTTTIFYLSVGEGNGFLPSLFKPCCSLFVSDLLKSKMDLSFNLELKAIFKIQISHFVANFQLTFSPCAITQNHFRLNSWKHINFNALQLYHYKWKSHLVFEKHTKEIVSNTTEKRPKSLGAMKYNWKLRFSSHQGTQRGIDSV